ncbi:MAG: phosphoglucosamine mutase [Alphaproteobacteria bacterium]|nr:phosphoglucosamine mutase [Alphaproteobacteria bacterium]
MTMKKLFGTDGVRGTANSWPMTPDVVLKLAIAAGHYFLNNLPKPYVHGDHRFTVVIGKDTRLSGYMVESALVSGFVAMGIDVILLGPLPTPAVAMLTRSLRANLGVMISASHNPYQDNGIKFFTSDGSKLSDDEEQAIEALTFEDVPLAPVSQLGKAKRLDDAAGRYIEFAKATFPRGQRLDGLKIVVDCAHGAAYKVAPRVLWELGADVVALAVDPNGSNINDGCGVMDLAALQKQVLETESNVGIALDGDADRLIMIDEKGRILDGDQLMALIASVWYERGMLKGDGVVGTVMSNLGFERYLETKGLTLYRASVGDRSVLETMKEKGCNVGGEQSGHIVLNDYATTGDGLIAALQVLSLMQQEKRKASELGHTFAPVPQILRNVRTAHPVDLAHPVIQQAIRKAEDHLLPHGHLLVRRSGTEPVIRLMAQGDDELLLARVLHDLTGVIQSVSSEVV